MIKKFQYLSSKQEKNQIDLEKNFFLYIVGKPGAGKTSIIEEMLLNEELLKNKYDYIFVFSPTKFQAIELKEGENWFINLNVDDLFKIIDELNKVKGSKETLFIFDDQIGLIKQLTNDPNFIKFIFNRRHLIEDGKISIIITSQKYIMLPTNFRSNITQLLFFGLTEKDYKAIKEDCYSFSSDITKEIQTCFDFIFIDLVNNKIYKNFLKKIN